MIDNYSKVVLTVIALSLAVIAHNMITTPAVALGDGCGESYNPCYVRYDE